MRTIRGTLTGKAALFATTLVIGAFATTSAFAQTDTGKSVKDPVYTSSIQVKETNDTEAVALRSQAKLDISKAEQNALTANPGTKVVQATLENENGNLIYSVILDNAMDVKVDAGNGTVLNTEKAGQERKDRESADTKDREASDSEQDQSGEAGNDSGN
jgi:uncharacterized membrane protein YkoI